MKRKKERKKEPKMELKNSITSVSFEDKFVFTMNPFDIEATNVDNSTIENLEDLFRLRNKIVDEFLSMSAEVIGRRSKRGYKVYDKVSML